MLAKDSSTLDEDTVADYVKALKKLFVIEGFDRAGKDTLLNDLEKIENKKFYVYKSDLSGLPKYDKEQSDFRE